MLRATLRSNARRHAERFPPAVPATARMLPYDIRLNRERTHRRLVVSMMRRAARVLSLHLLDATLLFGALILLGRILPPEVAFAALVPAMVGTFLLCLNAVSAYDSGDARRDRVRLAFSAFLVVLIFACLSVFPPHVSIGSVALGTLGIVGFVALAFGRKVADLLVRQAYVHGIGLRRAIVIGNLDQAGDAIRQLRDDRNIDQYVVGHVAPDPEPDPAALGVVSHLPRILAENDVQEVLIATMLPPARFREVAECCFERGTTVFVLPSVASPRQHCRSEPLRVGACTLLHLHPARLELPSLLLKRAFDLVVASIALIVAIPLIAVLALAIRIESRGPVFFRQQRVGLGGRVFTMWKFRSMHVAAEERLPELANLNSYGDGRLFKLRQDPRVTRMGRFLRRTSLDELPQLFNVLWGDMSLVGPRPPLRSEVAMYQPHHFDRLRVVPGMTGPWQVGGRNLITDFERVVQMERAYIRSWTLGLDAKILFRTIRVVVRGEGAY